MSKGCRSSALHKAMFLLIVVGCVTCAKPRPPEVSGVDPVTGLQPTCWAPPIAVVPCGPASSAKEFCLYWIGPRQLSSELKQHIRWGGRLDSGMRWPVHVLFDPEVTELGPNSGVVSGGLMSADYAVRSIQQVGWGEVVVFRADYVIDGLTLDHPRRIKAIELDGSVVDMNIEDIEPGGCRIHIPVSHSEGRSGWGEEGVEEEVGH